MAKKKKKRTRRRKRRNTAPKARAKTRKRRATPKRKKRNSWKGQPRRHAKASKKGWSRRKRRVKGYKSPKQRRGRYVTKRNGVLPYFAHNGVLPYFAHNGAMDVAMDYTRLGFWTREVLPVTVGFVGTKAISGVVRNQFGWGAASDGFNFVGHAVNVGSAALLSAGTYIATKDSRLTTRVAVGGGLMALYEILSDTLGKTGFGEMLGLSGLGMDPLDEETKARVAAAVQQASGGRLGAFLDTQGLLNAPKFGGNSALGAFVTTQDLANAPRFDTGAEVIDAETAMGDFDW